MMEEVKQMDNFSKVKDLEIPVPWGSVFVRAWGSESLTPVIALHGIQHNACSFDRLIPLLPSNYHYVSVDLPGHGKSSSFTGGLPLEMIHYVLSVKKVVDYLKFDRFVIIGHSLGAQLALFLSSLFPERVIKIVMIDGLTPVIVPTNKSVEHLKKHIGKLEKIEETLTSKKPPSYTYEEALDKFKNNGRVELTEEGARTLVDRSLIPSGSGFRFSTDQRLKLLLRPLYTMRQLQNFIFNIKCPIFMIIAEDTYNYYEKIIGANYHERLNILFHLPSFKHALVKGNHNVHINYPERVANHISTFLLDKKCSL